jgi:bifunctional DNA-binding transcriptional regulator/antitoxin component of YhaV-PrlF toxin-antitoxin module
LKDEFMKSKRFVVDVDNRGRLTIPAEVRRFLGLASIAGIVSFEIQDDNTVTVSRGYPSLESIVGAAGKLDRHHEWHEVQEIAREDWLMANYGPDSDFAKSSAGESGNEGEGS